MGTLEKMTTLFDPDEVACASIWRGGLGKRVDMLISSENNVVRFENLPVHDERVVRIEGKIFDERQMDLFQHSLWSPYD